MPTLSKSRIVYVLCTIINEWFIAPLGYPRKGFPTDIQKQLEI